MKTLTFQAMGSRIFVAIDSEDEKEIQLLNQVPQWFSKWERTLSRFIPTSELSILNQESGRWIPISNILWDVLLCAKDAYGMSGGLVDISMLGTIQKFGYTHDFNTANLNESIHPLGSDYEKGSDFRSMQFDASQQAIFIPHGCMLDLGGVAKGWAAQQTMLRLSQSAPTLVNAGGDIAISGEQTNGESWTIGISDPIMPDQSIRVLSVKSGGVATSGKDYHKWHFKGKSVHHILDPRTQRPAQTNILTSTILAHSVMEAEMVAKTTFILGSRQGLEWLKIHPEFTGIFILDDKSIISNEKVYTII
jgi:thiamine biosynthesis lipoprotein